MDYERRRRSTVEQRASLLQGDEFFSNRILSRDSSVGCSSRIYYCRSSEGVPFNWEMQPGTAKDPPKQDVIPPLSPPPAVLSLGLPKPCIKVEEPKPSIMRLRFRFWKQSKTDHGTKKLGRTGSRESYKNLDATESDKYANFEMCSSDGDFMSASPPRVSSSSSSSFSFSNGHSSRLSRSESPSSRNSQLSRSFGCSPWNFSSIVVRVVKRI